jgi:hypothetical protein
VLGDHSPPFRSSSVPPPNRGYVLKQSACQNTEIRSETYCVSEAVLDVLHVCRRRKSAVSGSIIFLATHRMCRARPRFGVPLWNILPNFGNQRLQRREIWQNWDCMRGFHVCWDRWSRSVLDFGLFCALRVYGKPQLFENGPNTGAASPQPPRPTNHETRQLKDQFTLKIRVLGACFREFSYDRKRPLVDAPPDSLRHSNLSHSITVFSFRMWPLQFHMILFLDSYPLDSF